MTFTIELSYPAPVLSPNARAHWRKVHVARQAQQQEAMALALNEINQQRWHGVLRSAKVALTFHAPTKRRYDLDNALASMKAALDGIAAALGIDDSLFTLTLKRGKPRQGGAVRVTVTAT